MKSERKRLTSEMVKRLWQEVAVEKYGARVKAKKDSSLMRFSGRVLDTIGIMDAEDFMNDYSTTIGRNIYLSFELGRGTETGLAIQAMICAHELMHVKRWKENPIGFPVLYLIPKYRARYEAEAYVCSMEVAHWYLDRVLNVEYLLNGLHAYGLNDKQLAVARKELVEAAEYLSRGEGARKQTSIDVIKWLSKHM